MVTTSPTSETSLDGEPTFLISSDATTGETLGRVAMTPPEEVESVAAEVAVARRAWAGTPLRERGRVIAEAAQVLLRRSDELATSVTRETGKPLMESSAIDVGGSALVLDWIGHHAPRILAPERIATPQLMLKHKRHTIVYRPLGVVGVIAAWNYPLLVPVGPVAMALVAGNGVVLKPSEHTPLSGDLLASVFADAGLPDGVLRVVHGAGPTGEAICRAPSIAKVCFTGGVANGERVRRLAAEHGKSVVLELGGNDAAIVCHDADLDRAVAGTLWAGIAGAGQTCAAVERVYVDRRVYPEYLRRLLDGAAAIRLGNPMDAGTQLGPLISQGQFERVRGPPRRRRCEGRDPRVRRTGRGRGPVRAVHRSGDSHRRRPLDGRDAGGDLRSGGPGHAVRHRGRRDPPRQRHDLRPGHERLDARHAAGAPDRPAACDRHGLDQRPRVIGRRRPGTVGRREGLGPRRGPLEVRAVRDGRQAPAVRGPRPAAGTVVVSLRRGRPGRASWRWCGRRSRPVSAASSSTGWADRRALVGLGRRLLRRRTRG